MTQSPLFTMAFWLVLIPSLWACGSLAGFNLREKNPLFLGVLTLGLGLGVFSYFLILVGSLGWLNQYAILCFFTLTLTFGWRRGMAVFPWLKEVFRLFWEPRDFFSRICQWSLVMTIFFTVLFCFLPEIANDALAIQLCVAKLFVRNASIAPSFYDIASYRPLLMSVLYSAGLLFQNVAIAKFFHWICGVLLVLALAIKVEELTQSKKLALFLGLMLWLTPTLMNQITTTYIDAGVSLFVFLGYCVVMVGFNDFKKVNFFYGGMLIGLAIAIRSLSVGAFFAILAILSLRLFQRGFRMRVVAAGICFALGVLVSSAYWFLRSWIYTGNPVFPFLGALFGTEDLPLFTSIYYHGMGLPRSPVSFLAIPWDITFKPQFFDYHHWLGPFYLSVLPFAGYAFLKIKRARLHLQFTLFFTIFWYFTGQNVRYLLPVFSIYLLATSLGLSEFKKYFYQKRWGNHFVRMAACLAVVSLLGLTTYHFRYQFFRLFGIWDGPEYLKKMERTIPIAQWIDQNLPRDAKILLLSEVRFFYFDRDVALAVHFLVRKSDWERFSLSEGVSFLRENGVTHVLGSSEVLPEGYLGKTQCAPFLASVLSNHHFSKKVATIRSSNILGGQYQYVLYELV